MGQRAARENPVSAPGVLLTLLGFGLIAFSGFELATGGKSYKTKPAAPKVKTPTRPAAPKAPAALGPAPSAAAASPSGPKLPTQAQVQQAVQAGQAIVSGADSLFGGSTPSVDASADASVSTDATGNT
jgi:hypothetical protein